MKQEALAGITPKSLVYDEIGKAPMKEAFLAGIKDLFLLMDGVVYLY